MSSVDFVSIFQWWLTFFIIGIIFIPTVNFLFFNFFDKGYIFAKIIGIVVISYFVFILGFLKIIPFGLFSISISLIIFFVLNLLLALKNPNILPSIKKMVGISIFEEIIFLLILVVWAYIHANQPEIHGLEKYMDFGFINSILRTKYFPPPDMWLTPLSINYYYFGHLVTAVLTKASFLSSNITFNLMLSAITALGFTAAFSITANLFKNISNKISIKISIVCGLLGGFLLSFAGNLHTIYLFFKPYENENPAPLWKLAFSPSTFPNNYWYPNATRFIHNTIHEFPIYSSVVSDLHGHFLDIPFVILTISILLTLFLKSKLKSSISKFEIILVSFLLAIMYMTNAWDGVIYFILTAIIIGYIIFKSSIKIGIFKNRKIEIVNFNLNIKQFLIYIFVLGIGFIVFSLPFNLNFKPFASGVGILCAPRFLTDIGHLGPFIFEKDHCQHSPFWQLIILYGFFYFWVISFIVFIRSKLKNKKPVLGYSDIFVTFLVLLSTILILIPEFIYVKDIYPAHYRANTMFKLVYQGFILLSLSSAYIIIRLFQDYKFLILDKWYYKLTYWVIGASIVTIVSFYPYFAIKSYFGDLNKYSGLDGTTYLKNQYPDDYKAILWINKNIKEQPIILEAQGDSYTDYARVSTNTGLPTVLGWTVHEWLWRGSYDIPSPRIQEISDLYETSDIEKTKTLLNKYKISFVFIGDLERQKYNLNEKKFKSLGKIIYQKGKTKIFKIY